METNTGNYAEKELALLCKTYPTEENPPIIKEFIPEILALCEKFGKSGQSGGSAPMVAGAIADAVKKLCMQQPICPVTGLEEEWVEVGEQLGVKQFQNSRCSALFKHGDGEPYYLDAIVWKGDTKGADGAIGWDTFTGTVDGIKSRQTVKSFPFKPKTFYIDVSREKFDPAKHKTSDAVTTGLDGDVVYFIKDKSQLEAVWEYYKKSEGEPKA